jgi:hypothetical protein
MQCNAGDFLSWRLALARRRLITEMPRQASVRRKASKPQGKVNLRSRVSVHPFTHSDTAATAMSTSRTPFVCASCTRTLRASVKPNAIRSFSTTLAKSAGAPSPDEPRWKQTPPQMKMPFRLRPQPNQPVWKVNENVELVDDAFDKFVGQAGGKGTRGCELLPEEIKVSRKTSVPRPSVAHEKRV